MSEAEQSDIPAIAISEHSRVLIAVHRAMRADAGRLVTAVGALPSGDTERATALGRAFAAVVGLIHDHHWTEDDVMYPFLLRRVASFKNEAIGLEDEHVELDAAMARINARFRRDNASSRLCLRPDGPPHIARHFRVPRFTRGGSRDSGRDVGALPPTPRC